ncbi:hypothetical protein POSPLADRAFT_1131708, partial [Postia placenta MAD-698-R-SB12]
EIWLLIVDELGAKREYDASEACIYASEGFIEERAERYLPSAVVFRTQEEVANINLVPRWKGPYTVRIEGGVRGGERLPIPHLTTFASRLARKWTRAANLRISRAEWRLQNLDQHSVLINLSCFDNVKRLFLYDVTFPSVLTFWRLVCALPRLERVHLRNVRIVRTAINARILATLCLLPATRVVTIHLSRPEESGVERPGSTATRCAGLLQAIVAHTIPSLKTSPWSKITILVLWDVILPTAGAFSRLLHALPALQELTIKRPCMFLANGFDSKCLPEHPATLPQLRCGELGEDFSIHSDHQSVHDLFIQTGAGGRLQSITAWLIPPLRVATGIDVALNGLVKHAGQSLRNLDLTVLPQGSFPLSNEASTYAAPIQACCFDVPANSHLKRLEYSVDTTHEGISSIAPLVELLHQVTSPQLFSIDLFLEVMDKANLAKLWTGLSHLDVALSRSIFDKLRNVDIYFILANDSIHIPGTMVRSCLPNDTTVYTPISMPDS